MKRCIVGGVTVLVLCLSACSLGPTSHVTGRWGGRGVSLDARSADVQLQFTCSGAVSPELSLAGDGHFEGTAHVTAVSWAGPAPTILRLSGTLSGDVMSLSIATLWPPSGGQADTIITRQAYTLRLGAAPDFSGYGCLG